MKGGKNTGGKPAYAGRISNKGSQVVEPPITQEKGKSGTVIRGNDLRSGKGGK